MGGWLIHGLRARGACTINMDWRNGMLTGVNIQSDKGGSYTIRYKEKTNQIQLKRGEKISMDGNLKRIKK